MKQFRHGDVFLQEVTPPARAGRRRRPGAVLAEGEVTGHAHRVVGDYELYERDGRMYLRVRSEAALVHEEHHHMDLPRGTYQVTLQREWMPSLTHFERVRD